VAASDLVVVNAEGTLHTHRENPERWVGPLLDSIRDAALVHGKAVHVVNMGLYPDLSSDRARALFRFGFGSGFRVGLVLVCFRCVWLCSE